jgi:hypothetical protein
MVHRIQPRAMTAARENGIREARLTGFLADASRELYSRARAVLADALVGRVSR